MVYAGESQALSGKVGLALVHYPVRNRHGETIGSAVTNLDIHDLARAAKTYGVERFWLVVPQAEQQAMVWELLDHWLEGRGGEVNPDRKEALQLVRVCATVAEAAEGMNLLCGKPPTLLATSAQPHGPVTGFAEVKRRLQGGEDFLLLLGTAWGLAPEAVNGADGMLEPLSGSTGYNHLSVRTAGAIILDRLLGR